ncbi:MAG: hypothetical protein HKN34_07495 [Gammaproteobacteria bacterium]|nr:hypothetical protein [Gammaproteobacteria bacterium]
MKKIIHTLTVFLVLIWSSSSIADPIAPLAPLNSMGKQMFAAEGKTVADALKDVPSKEMVGLPAYPDAYFSGAMGQEDSISYVFLISKASAADVVAWYGKNLGKEWQNIPALATNELREIAVFIKSDKKEISAMDSLKYQQIRISTVEKPEDTGFAAMTFDVSGIKSMINMTIKPMM